MIEADPYAADRLAMAARLGQIDGAATMLDLRADAPVARVAALRLLRSLWSHFTLDRGLASTGIFEPTDAAERAAFLAILSNGQWLALDWAAEQVRAMLPAPIDPDAAVLVTHEALKRVRLVQTMIAEEPLTGPPDVRIAALVARLMALDAGFSESEGMEHRYVAGDLSWTRFNPGPPSDAWAINLAIVQGGTRLALGASVLPFPGIVRRELCRLDRGTAWREAALTGAIGRSGDTVLDALRAARADIAAIAAAVADRRATSRSFDAAVLLAGLDELTPTRLARALGCTRPGGVMILRDLAQAGLLARGGDPRKAKWYHSARHRGRNAIGWLAAWETV